MRSGRKAESSAGPLMWCRALRRKAIKGNPQYHRLFFEAERYRLGKGLHLYPPEQDKEALVLPLRAIYGNDIADYALNERPRADRTMSF